MPRPLKPYEATLEQVRITREGESAVIAYHDGRTATTHFHIGPRLADMTDQQVLDRFNQTIRIRAVVAAAYDHVAIEVPPGSPQVR